MPKPFPFPITLGTDICHRPRILDVLKANKNSKRFVDKVLVPEERGTFWAIHDGLGLEGASRFLSGRWAAKEAIVKAHQRRRLTFQDIRITSPRAEKGLGSRAPVAVVRTLSGREEDGQEVLVSISHDGDYAVAVCLAAEESVLESGSGVGLENDEGNRRYEGGEEFEEEGPCQRPGVTLRRIVAKDDAKYVAPAEWRKANEERENDMTSEVIEASFDARPAISNGSLSNSGDRAETASANDSLNEEWDYFGTLGSKT